MGAPGTRIGATARTTQVAILADERHSQDMRLALIVMLSTSLLVPLAACDPNPTSCTADARSSLVLTVVDAETGAELDTATVTYLVDGAEGSEAPVKLDGGRFALGLEDEGTFEVTASAEGYQSAMGEYEVTSDECHVITREETLSLSPSP
jgi:hypothetical protein